MNNLIKIQQKIRKNNEKLKDKGWLLNQYPLIKDRLLKENYLNFDNLNEFENSGINTSEVKRFLKQTDKDIVILMEINKNLEPTKPIILVDNLAKYYPHYELFRESIVGKKPFGWIEIFHNFKKLNEEY